MRKEKGVLFILSFILISFMILGSFSLVSAYTTCNSCQSSCEYGAASTPCSYGLINCDRTESCETGSPSAANPSLTPGGVGYKTAGSPSTGCGWGWSECDNVKPNQYCGDGIVNGAESCDAGASNGACPSACSASCTRNSCCAQSCSTASSVTCGGSLDSGNGCSTGCSATGGTYCATGTCISGTCKYVGSTYWTNLANSNKITTSQLGDTVRMVAAGSGFLEGQEVNYSIYKDSVSWFFFHKIAVLSSDLSADTWKVNETGDAIYFKAKTGALENTSTTLSVGSAANAAPVASIILPADGLKGSVNSSISFTQNSSDEDDLLNVSWNFGDGNLTVFNDYSLVTSSALANTQHKYSSGGIYAVTLRVNEMNRSNFDTASRMVYILQPGINVVPVITSPVNRLSYTNWVNFNASQSFVANCTRGPMNSISFSVGDLNCSYLHAPGTKTTGNYNLSVTWSVKESDNSVSTGFPLSGNWEVNYTNVVDSKRYFGSAAKRSAYLTLDYSA